MYKVAISSASSIFAFLHLTRFKVNQINLQDSLPYDAPKEVHADELEVVDEEVIENENKANSELCNWYYQCSMYYKAIFWPNIYLGLSPVSKK